MLKRKYELKGLQVSFVKKKINYKFVTIYYINQHGNRVDLGRYGPSDSIPAFDITASLIGIQF